MRRNQVVAIGVLVALILLAIVWRIVRTTRIDDDGSDTITQTMGSATHGIGTTAASRGPRTPAKPAQVSGRVTLKSDGSGVAGSVVSLARSELDTVFGGQDEPTLTATTDAQGAWSLTTVPPGRYTIAATAKGLLPGTLDKVVIAEGETRTGLDLILEAGGVRVSGTISDVGGGPVPGARVTIAKDSDTPFGSAEWIVLANNDGKYEVTLGDGEYEAKVSHEDYTYAQRGFEVAGQPLTIDFTLSPGGSIRGVVVTRDGAPLPDALVMASGSRGGGDSGGMARADAKGAFAIKSLGSGVVSLNASGRGWASEQPTVVELGIGEQVDDVRIVVDKAFTISGRVIEQGTKKGIPGVRLGVFSLGTQLFAVAPDPSDADGAFEIVGVKPASYMMFAIGEGTMPEIGKSIQVVDKDITDLEIEMGLGVTVTGRVDPAARATISIQPQQVGIGNIFEALKALLVVGEADATGAFTLKHVPPGSFTLRARVADGRAGSTPLLVAKVDMTGIVVKLEDRGSIAGRVVDAKGAPVPRVRINVSEKGDKDIEFSMGSRGPTGGLTGADGSFKIVGLEEGVHEIKVADDQGMIPWADPANKAKGTQPIEITLGRAEAKTGVVLTVETRDGVIKGVVVDKDKKPVADVWVTAHPDITGDPKEQIQAEIEVEIGAISGKPPTLTGSDGTFTFTNLRKDEYVISAETAKGTARADVRHVKIGSTVTLVLAPLGTVSGKITLAGKPVTAFSVTCSGAGSHEPRRFQNADGHYELERIPPGKVTCSASADAGRGEAEVEVPAGPVTLDIALQPFASITGTLVSVLDGKPLAGLKLLASGGDFSESGLEDVLGGKGPTSDSAGRFVIPQVAAGKGKVAVMPADGGFVSLAEREYEVSAGQRLDLGTIKVAPPRTGDAGTLGLSVNVVEADLVVTVVKPGGPAAIGGVQVGDKLVAINGIAVTQLTPKLAETLVSSGSVTIGQEYRLSLDRGGVRSEVVLVGVRW